MDIGVRMARPNREAGYPVHSTLPLGRLGRSAPGFGKIVGQGIGSLLIACNSRMTISCCPPCAHASSRRRLAHLLDSDIVTKAIAPLR
jgi:hypothetical protein